MSDNVKTNPDPIQGFHITEYDQESQTLTIAVDKRLFKNLPSATVMTDKAIEIIGSGPSVSKVIFVPRD